MARLDVAIVSGDILELRADVVVFKHAQGFYSLDGQVAERLRRVGVSSAELAVLPGAVRFVRSAGVLGAGEALFVGTVPLGRLGYHELRQLATTMLVALRQRPQVRHVATTIHGANSGLDEDEAVLALVGGLVEAFQRSVGPPSLERVDIVEKREGRARRLREALARGLAGTPGISAVEDGVFRVERKEGFVAAPALASAGATVGGRPHAFVAMPFSPEMEDVYHYGIHAPVRAAGLVCERVDQAVFDGPIIQRIRERIESARVVIADLTGANPNVYLEVGYAWGLKKPTVLVVRDVADLRFDVQSYRCLVYGGRIRTLEDLLARELASLGP